jgi:hypothetical protein
MLPARTQKSCRLVVLTITICIIGFPAYAKYSGGSGTANDPYQIHVFTDLITLGETPEDYDKNFIMTANVGFDRNNTTFDKAVIAPNTGDNWGEFQGVPFTGVFDGNGYTIFNLTITGKDYLGLFGELGEGAKVLNLGLENVSIIATGDYAGALTGKNFHGNVTKCYSTGTIGGKNFTGGLVGFNSYGYIVNCYSTCTVSSNAIELAYIGGLVGNNSYGTIAQCYSSGTVRSNLFRNSEIACVGGLIGFNSYGTVTQCYSSSSVTGTYEIGGLVGSDTFGKINKSYSTGDVTKIGTYLTPHFGGFIGNCFYSYVNQCYSNGLVNSRDAQGFIGQNNFGVVVDCFWDTQTSGRTTSMGGTGKTTVEMKTKSTYTSAGWDFTDETANGTEDIWRVCDGTSYPKFVRQLPEGDFVCPDGITIDEDFDFFMDHWGNTNCNQSNKYCDGTDLNFSGTVDIEDYNILLSIWLAENP